MAWQISADVLHDFSAAQGWTSSSYLRTVSQHGINSDGAADYVGFGYNQTIIALGGAYIAASEPGFFENKNAQGSAVAGSSTDILQYNQIRDFGIQQGYDEHHARSIDYTGFPDDYDLVYFPGQGYGFYGNSVWGQGDSGIYYYIVDGKNFAVPEANGKYVALPEYGGPEFFPEFGVDAGWNEHTSFQFVTVRPDVKHTQLDGFGITSLISVDSYVDIIGFGSLGVRVGALHAGYDQPVPLSYWSPGTETIGNNAGWDSVSDVRTLKDNLGAVIDLNGDHIADFVGMGPTGTVFALGREISAEGYDNVFDLGLIQTAHINGTVSDLGRTQGWDQQTTPRLIQDINGDGKADILAFGSSGVVLSLAQDPATHGGEAFGQEYLALGNFGLDQGWNTIKHLRLIGDVNGDGVADIVGFGQSQTFTALGTKDGTGRVTFSIDASLTLNDFGYSEGWRNDLHVRQLADVDGDGKADLVLSGAFDTYVWHMV